MSRAARAELLLRKFVRCVARCASAVFAPRSRVLLGKCFLGRVARCLRNNVLARTDSKQNILSLTELFLQRTTAIGCITSLRCSPPPLIVHRPRIETKSGRWQRCALPLDH